MLVMKRALWGVLLCVLMVLGLPEPGACAGKFVLDLAPGMGCDKVEVIYGDKHDTICLMRMGVVMAQQVSMPRAPGSPLFTHVKVERVDGGFLIKDAFCSGWFFVFSTMIFLYDENTQEFLLSEYREMLLDRRNPDNETMVTYTIPDYMPILFGDVQPSQINKLRQFPPKISKE